MSNVHGIHAACQSNKKAYDEDPFLCMQFHNNQRKCKNPNVQWMREVTGGSRSEREKKLSST